jgi:hypothetical protein
MHGAYLVFYRIYESAKAAKADAGKSFFITAAWRLFTLAAVTAAWVPFRSPNIHKAVSILSSMFVSFRLGTVYSSTFYVFTVAVSLFCVIEPLLMRMLAEAEERAGMKGSSPFRVLVRPVAYTCGLLLFMLFDEHNAQFIYSQF